MATLAEFRAQYPQYDSVPDVALADSLHEKFYSKIPKMDFYKAIGLGSAAAIPGAENLVTGRVSDQPTRSTADYIRGIAEVPAIVVGQMGAGIVDPIARLYGELSSTAKQGTPEAVAAGEAMAKKARAQFYQPRTELGPEIVKSALEFVSPITSALPPTLGTVGTTINALAVPSMQQAGAMTSRMATQAAAPIQNVLARRQQQPTMQGMGAASTAEDLMRQQRLEQFGIRATAGEREKNLQKQQFESDVRRGVLSGISEEAKTKLQEEMKLFETGKQKDIINNFERMTSEVGSTADRGEIRQTGRIVDKALNDEYTKKFDAYKEKYRLADESGETLEQVPYQSLLDYIGTKSTTRREKLDPILNDVAESLAMNDPQKTGTISIRNLEDIYQQVGTVKDSPSAKPLKDLITQIGDGAGGKLYQEARQARAQLAKEFEDVARVDKLLGTKAGYKDRRVALDDVYNHIVVDGSLEEMRTVTSLLKKTPEGREAYKELQGQTLQRMKDLLLKKGEEDTSLAFNNFKNFVTQLDREEKLAYMFGKAGRDKILDLRKTIEDVLVKEPGAVNYSNTSGAVLRGLEALQKLPIKIPGTKTVAEFARERQYKKQLEESLKQPNALAPKSQNALAP